MGSGRSPRQSGGVTKTPEERRIDLLRPSGGGRAGYALVYPNDYGVGMANLGYQTLWGLFSALEDARCERLFSGDARTREMNKRLVEFDVVALCVPFEGDYPAIVETLVAQGIAPLAADRPEDAPLVIAGGVAPSLNPEVLAPIADAIYIGEAEANRSRFHEFLLHRLRRGGSKEELLRTLAAEGGPGWYVPAAYEVEYLDGDSHRKILWDGAPERVELARAPAGWEPAHTRASASDDAFGGAFLLETVRGCPHGCAFCAIGHFGGKTRFIETQRLEPFIEMGLSEVGRLGLVGAAVGDHPRFKEIARRILDGGGKFTVSSFRAEILDEESLELLALGGLKTLTVALEAGSCELRRSINKRIEAERVVEAAGMARSRGLTGMRIYAMVGLPGETDEDVKELAEVAASARKALVRGRLTLSVAPFVPKPHTPLQWEAMADEAIINRRIRLLKKTLGPLTNTQVSAESPKWSRVQGLFSRGDRRVGALLASNPPKSAWGKLLKEPLSSAILGPRQMGAERISAPWDFIGGAPVIENLVKAHGKLARD